ncbi:MAG: hypothetical protein ABIS03_01310 [Gemmatimonadaceae bacterium]
MAFIDKLKEELDRAGRAAQGALDEGKTRIEAFRTRQLADKAAQALGYAVFRAKSAGGEIDADTYDRLAATLAAHDADAARYEADIERRRTDGHADDMAGSSGPVTAPAAPMAADPPPEPGIPS